LAFFDSRFSPSSFARPTGLKPGATHLSHKI
jgi:hypothetical protein